MGHERREHEDRDRGVTRRTVLWTLITLGFASPARAQLDPVKAARVKEGLLHHLSQLTRWPADERDSNAPVVVALYGARDEVLRRLLLRRAERGEIEVTQVARPGPDASARRRTLDKLRHTNMVYFGNESTEAFLKNLWGSPVLLVGEGPNFARDVGMVGFVLREGRIQIEVNLKRARASGLSFSAQLLQHATIIGER